MDRRSNRAPHPRDDPALHPRRAYAGGLADRSLPRADRNHPRTGRGARAGRRDPRPRPRGRPRRLRAVHAAGPWEPSQGVRGRPARSLADWTHGWTHAGLHVADRGVDPLEIPWKRSISRRIIAFSKSATRKGLWVRVPPSVPRRKDSGIW
jgi:hypothetical protein